VYCAGCNGSFELSFQTTTVGTAAGVHGVGMNIVFSDPGLPYFAYILFADGTTANIPLPVAGSFWGVSAPERIERIHFGLSMGGTTQSGGFGIDNLVIGDGNLGGCMIDADCPDDDDPCTNQECVGGGCQSSPVICDDEDPCTDDACEPRVGCTATPNTAPCDDEDACTLDDACFEGSCGGEPVDCNDDDACTVDYCDPDRGGECFHSEEIDCCDDDSDCPDGFYCSVDACAPDPSGGTMDGADESAGPSDAGIDDTGGSSGGNATGGLDTGLASTGADTGSGFDQDAKPDFSVCACTTTPAPESRLWWLMVPLGLALRRRRRAARA
jgi:MYXO-CTERM domain-containing protein